MVKEQEKGTQTKELAGEKNYYAFFLLRSFQSGNSGRCYFVSYECQWVDGHVHPPLIETKMDMVMDSVQVRSKTWNSWALVLPFNVKTFFF